MNSYYLIPFFLFNKARIYDNTIKSYLVDKLFLLRKDFNQGLVSISNCMNAQLCLSSINESSLWLLDVIRNNLILDGICTSYSIRYSEQLNKFDQQSFQNDIYTEYYYWKILLINDAIDSQSVEQNIVKYQNKSGFFYNSDNSDTLEKYRMKSELYSQLLMAKEIINFSNAKDLLLPDISSDGFRTSYISSEYFRERYCSLSNVNANTPQAIIELINQCKVEYGLCDFNAKKKFDDFMGTAKRTSRDKSIFSPLATLHGIYLCDRYNLLSLKNQLINEAHQYYDLYRLDLESFQMRDIPIDFGPGDTVVEILAFNTILNLNDCE